MKKKLKFLVGVMLGVMLMGMPVLAAEYTVTEVSQVMYTNAGTVILTDADNTAVLLPEVAAGLPIQVTGITSNGYYQINLAGQTLYIKDKGLTSAESTTPAAAPAAAVADSTNTRAQEVYNILIAQKATYPEGMSWTNANYVPWNGGTYTGGYGCAGFAFALSDAAFGNAKATKHTDYTNIKVGDILRVENGTHSVIVLEVNGDSLTVAEGNYNASVHWGRTVSVSSLPGEGNYIMTRY